MRCANFEACFWASPVWTDVGTMAQVVSLIAVVFAIREILIRRWAALPVSWSLEYVGELVSSQAHEPGASEAASGREFPGGIFRIRNSGTHTASILRFVLVGAEAKSTRDYRIDYWLPADSHMDFLVTSNSIDRAWLFLMWTDGLDRRYAHAQWFPFLEDGYANDDFEESLRATPERNEWRPWKRARAVRPVGPGGRARSRLRLKYMKVDFAAQDVIMQKILDPGVTAQMFAPSRSRVFKPGTGPE
jgi:hypothetical protein